MRFFVVLCFAALVVFLIFYVDATDVPSDKSSCFYNSPLCKSSKDCLKYKNTDCYTIVRGYCVYCSHTSDNEIFGDYPYYNGQSNCKVNAVCNDNNDCCSNQKCKYVTTSYCLLKDSNDPPCPKSP